MNRPRVGTHAGLYDYWPLTRSFSTDAFVPCFPIMMPMPVASDRVASRMAVFSKPSTHSWIVPPTSTTSMLLPPVKPEVAIRLALPSTTRSTNQVPYFGEATTLQ